MFPTNPKRTQKMSPTVKICAHGHPNPQPQTATDNQARKSWSATDTCGHLRTPTDGYGHQNIKLNISTAFPSKSVAKPVLGASVQLTQSTQLTLPSTP